MVVIRYSIREWCIHRYQSHLAPCFNSQLVHAQQNEFDKNIPCHALWCRNLGQKSFCKRFILFAINNSQIGSIQVSSELLGCSYVYLVFDLQQAMIMFSKSSNVPWYVPWYERTVYAQTVLLKVVLHSVFYISNWVSK